MATAEKPKGGLEDVVATSSAICYLDGDRGVLAYCGYDIHDLASAATFEEVCYLLWHRRLPTRAELGDLQSQFAAARALPEPIQRLMRSLPPVDGMDALRTLTSALGHYDREANDSSPQAQYRKAIRLTAQVGTLVAAWGRLQAGGGFIEPDPVMGHAANFLYMLTGNRPNATAIKAFDVALVPYVRTAYTETVFPTKLFEYLAMKRPVVSTDLPEVVKLGLPDFAVRVAGSSSAFVAATQVAIDDADPAHASARRALSLQRDWASIVDRMARHIADVLPA